MLSYNVLFYGILGVSWIVLFTFLRVKFLAALALSGILSMGVVAVMAKVSHCHEGDEVEDTLTNAAMIVGILFFAQLCKMFFDDRR